MSNVNSDLLDAGLQAVMSKDRCQDVTEQMKKNPNPIQGTPVKEKHDPMPARWEYAEENWLDKLKKMVKGIMTPALLCLFFFYCQQTEQMVSDTAVCAMFVCVGVVFFRIGRAAK